MTLKTRKILLVVILGVFALCILIGVLSDGDDKPTESPSQVAAQPAETPKPEAPKYALPDQGVFLDYVKGQFKQTVDTDILVLDTILTDPVDIEAREYKLDSGGKPDIALTAYVKEMQVGQQGALVSQAILAIVLDWLIKQGFEPQKQWIMPSCSVMMREQGATGQATVRVFGRSDYDPNTDTIDWSPAK